MSQEIKEESRLRHSSEVQERLVSSAIVGRQQLSLQQLYCDSSKLISVVLRTQDLSLFSDDVPENPQNLHISHFQEQRTCSANEINMESQIQTYYESTTDKKTEKNQIIGLSQAKISDSTSPLDSPQIKAVYVGKAKDICPSSNSGSLLTNSGSFVDDSMNSEYSRVFKTVQDPSVVQKNSLSQIPAINTSKPVLFKAGVVIKEVMRNEQQDIDFKRHGGHFNLLKNEFEMHKKIGNHSNILRVLSFCEHKNGAFLVMPWAKFGDCDLFIQWQLFNLQKLQHSVADMRNLISVSSDFFVHPKKIEELEDKRIELHSYIQNTLIKGSLEPCIFALRSMTKQIGQALYFLHEKHGIAHNDIKPDNFYIKRKRTNKSNYIFQLADFGYASQQPFETQQEALDFFSKKSTRFFSPELHQLISKKQENLPIIDCKKVDIFALGLSIFQILTGGFFPFKDDPNDIQFKRFLEGDLTVNILLQSFSPYFSQVTPYNDFLDLLSHMLDPNPQTRFDIKAVLSHPWLKNFKSKNHFPAKNSTETEKQLLQTNQNINTTKHHNNNNRPIPIMQTHNQQQIGTQVI